MPLGLAVLLWAAEVVPGREPGPPAPILLSAADLARTSSVMRGQPPAAAPPAPAIAPPRQAERAPEAPADLAVLVGSRSEGAQLEMGALGGGRADAPGLVHVGVGLDF